MEKLLGNPPGRQRRFDRHFAVAKSEEAAPTSLLIGADATLKCEVIKLFETNIEIVSALGKQLSWTHWRQLIAVDDSLKRDFYTQMCRIERWSSSRLFSEDEAILQQN